MLRLLALLLLIPLSSACSIFQLGDYDRFGDWYVGDVGLAGATKAGESDMGQEKRKPWFGHLRTPELLFQPAGGLKFPAYQSYEGGCGQGFCPLTGLDGRDLVFGCDCGEPYRVRTLKGELPSLAYDLYDAGAVEIFVPYKILNSHCSRGKKTQAIVSAPLPFMIGSAFRLTAYVVHDALKTAMIPVAALFYSLEPKESASREDPRQPHLHGSKNGKQSL